MNPQNHQNPKQDKQKGDKQQAINHGNQSSCKRGVKDEKVRIWDETIPILERQSEREAGLDPVCMKSVLTLILSILDLD